MIAHAIANARACPAFDRVLVSTDSAEIAAAARSLGAEVPFLRPAELAEDSTPMREVLLHAYRELASAGRPPPALALLQPTSPFLKPATIERAVESFRASRALVLKAVVRVRQHPAWMLARRGEELVPYQAGPVLRRQDLPELFIPCGALYLYREGYLQGEGEGEALAWIEVEWPESLDIDEPRDLEIAEWVLERGPAGGKRAPS